LLDHPCDDVIGGVEGAGGVAGDGTGFGVVGGEEVFKDVAEEVGVEGKFLFKRGIFGNGEDVVVEDGKEGGDGNGGLGGIAGGGGEVGGLVGAEEKEVGNTGAFGGVRGESRG